MPDGNPRGQDAAYQFILENIDSVPQLEGLVLLWQSRPAGWTQEELATRLYITPERALEVIRHLVRIGLVAESSGPPVRFRYSSSSAEQDELMSEVHTTYRCELVRVSHTIHSKASSAVREFARAFRVRKGQDT